MPTMSDAKQMSQFAKMWRRGNLLFKAAYEEGPIDPSTNTHSYTRKEITDPAVASLVSKCNVKEIVTFINYEATPKEAQKAKFQAIFCLGQTAMDQEEANRNSTQLLTNIAKRNEK